MNIAVLAEIKFKSDHLNSGLAILKSIIKPSQAEIGCLYYELYQSPDDPNTFLMLESWESKDVWDQHLASAHNQQAGKDIQPYIESLKIKWFNKV